MSKNATPTRDQRLTQMSSKLDGALTQFDMTRNKAGQTPWEEAQDAKKKKTLAKTAVGAAAGVAAGVGARKVYNAYGGADGAPLKEVGRNVARDVGRTAGDIGSRVKAAGAIGSDAFKGAAAKVTDGTKAAVDRTGKYAKKVGSEGFRRGKASLRMTGEMKKPLLQRGMKAGAAVLRGVKSVRFERIGRITELSSKLDEVLVDFGSR